MLDERRSRTFTGRLARAVYPAAKAVGEALQDAPCRVLGHHWVEVPPSLRRSVRPSGTHDRMRFECSRCFLVGGFTN